LTSSTSVSDLNPQAPGPAHFTGSIEAELVFRGEPHEIMERLVRFAAESVQVDRCTLTSLDQNVLRVEASYEPGGRPDFVGREYPLAWLARQPLLSEAVRTGAIVFGGSLGDRGDSEPDLAPSLLSIRHTAIVPLAIGEAVGAVLILSRRSDRPFVPRELEGLQQVGPLAVLALRNARLVDAVQSAQRRGLDALTQMSRHMASSVEPATYFEKMSETVAGLVSAEHAGFWQLTCDELIPLHQPGTAVEKGAAGRQARGVLNARGDADLARLLMSGEAVRRSLDDPSARTHPESMLARLRAHDVLAVPWRTATIPLGILAAWDSSAGFSDQDEWIIRLAARSSALVWQGYAAEQRAQGLQAAELDRLETHAQRMAVLEQQKSEFLQLASHELRGPITLVSGYLSMLEEGSLGDLPAPAAKVVPLMATRMRHMSELVDRMLTTSRMEIRARGQNAKEVSLDALARAVAAAASTGLSGQARLVSVHSAGRVRVRADPEQVETILSNLVSNALKYSPGGGEVTVTVRTEPGWAAVDVTDSGEGIADVDLPKLFQPFGRLPDAVAAGIEGTGLGLHLSRGLAQAQGGDIDVTSHPGQGSTFTLRLPRGRQRPVGRDDA
jgi:signal transduction histidine kinase